MTDDEIDAKIEAWHEGKTPHQYLHEALGWSRDQYAAWVQGFGEWKDECPEKACNGTHRWARWPEEDGSLGWVISHTLLLANEDFDKLQEALGD